MPVRAPDVQLVVGGLAFTNWTEYELSADYESPADAWSVTVGNVSPAQVGEVTLGAGVRLLVDDQVVLSGLVEERSLDLSRAGGLVLKLGGRDLAAPLVDCQPWPNTSWRKQTLRAIAEAMLTELGIAATVEAEAEAEVTLQVVKAQPGETFWAVLARECAKAGLMPAMTPAGALQLGRPDYDTEPVATLRLGGSQANVLSAAYTQSLSGRFTDLLCVGQAPGDGFSEGAKCKGFAQDQALLDLGLYRPSVVDAGGDLRSNAEAKARAGWEVSHRRYQGETLELTVPGHGPALGEVWAPNTSVDLVDELLGLSGLWWLSGRRLARDRSRGTTSTLTLHPPKTLLPPVGA